MGKIEKLLIKILKGDSDKNIRFHEMQTLLLKLGFEERKRGSHHVYRKQGVNSLINLQKDNGYCKSYQVKQIRKVIVNYKIGILKDEI